MPLSFVDFSAVKNRNEKKVIKAMEKFYEKYKGTARIELLSTKDYQDVYALVLNALPARYTQNSTIVLGDPVREEDIVEAVFDAFDTVLNHPKP